jgi:hypothetical protein
MDEVTNEMSNMPLEDIATRCAEETQKYFQKRQDDTDYCFELLRQALEVDASEAFTHVYRTYEALVRRWVYSHPRFQGAGEPADYFVSAAFTSFYFAVRGDKFKRFDTLPQLLQYLKRCVHTSIAQHFRGMELSDMVPLESDDRSPISHTEKFSDFVDIWDRINELLPNDVDRLLAHCVFSQNLKPSQIIELHPYWESAREISVQLQRIRRGLRQDGTLRVLLGMEDGTD